jgi:hypothetical protein
MVYYKLAFLALLLILFVVSDCASEKILRTTESGEDCILPFTYNGKEFSDCLFSSKEKNNKKYFANLLLVE